jgi:hypothetical protein
MEIQLKCPFCQNEDESLLEITSTIVGSNSWTDKYLCVCCTKLFKVEYEKKDNSIGKISKIE